MALRKVVAAAVIAVAFLHSTGSAAQTRLGDGVDALPGVLYVPIASPFVPGVVFNGIGGYGYTESVLGTNDVHHRLAGVFGVSARPISWLAFALRLDGRYDVNQSQGHPNTDGFVGDPRVEVRGAWRVADVLGLGVQATLWLPSGQAPSVDANAASGEFVGMVSYAPDHGWLSAGLVGGYRIDRSVASVSNPSQLRADQRLGLGLSAFDAAIVGVAAVAHVRSVEILGEWRWDVLVGTGAPDASVSPMHVRAGVRWQPIDDHSLRLGAMLDVSPSNRPSLADANSPLVESDPRVSVWLTLGVGLPFDQGPPRFTTLAASHAAPRRGPLTGGTAEHGANGFTGTVMGPDDAPIAHAHVHVVAPGGAIDVATDATGTYRFPASGAGTYALTVSAEGRPDVSNTFEWDPTRGTTMPTETRVRMEAPLPSGQVRGSVQSYDGHPLQATVRILELNVSRVAGADGTFELNVQPGRFTVEISADGFVAQQRPVGVELHGVTVLNVDMRRDHRAGRRDER